MRAENFKLAAVLTLLSKMDIKNEQIRCDVFICIYFSIIKQSR